jgi:hypothetical protein
LPNGRHDDSIEIEPNGDILIGGEFTSPENKHSAQIFLARQPSPFPNHPSPERFFAYSRKNNPDAPDAKDLKFGNAASYAAWSGFLLWWKTRRDTLKFRNAKPTLP